MKNKSLSSVNYFAYLKVMRKRDYKEFITFLTKLTATPDLFDISGDEGSEHIQLTIKGTTFIFRLRAHVRDLHQSYFHVGYSRFPKMEVSDVTSDLSLDQVKGNIQSWIDNINAFNEENGKPQIVMINKFERPKGATYIPVQPRKWGFDLDIHGKTFKVSIWKILGFTFAVITAVGGFGEFAYETGKDIGQLSTDKVKELTLSLEKANSELSNLKVEKTTEDSTMNNLTVVNDQLIKSLEEGKIKSHERDSTISALEATIRLLETKLKKKNDQQ